MEGRRFLVGHDGSAASTRALAEAAWLARARHGCLTVVLAPPRVPRWAGFAPVSFAMLEDEAWAEADCELARAIESLPARVSITRLFSPRPLGAALLEVWRRGEHDAVVLAAVGRPCHSAARALRRAGVEPIVIGAAKRSRRDRKARARWTRRARPARPA